MAFVNPASQLYTFLAQQGECREQGTVTKTVQSEKEKCKKNCSWKINTSYQCWLTCNGDATITKLWRLRDGWRGLLETGIICWFSLLVLNHKNALFIVSSSRHLTEINGPCTHNHVYCCNKIKNQLFCQHWSAQPTSPWQLCSVCHQTFCLDHLFRLFSYGNKDSLCKLPTAMMDWVVFHRNGFSIHGEQSP